MDAVSFAEQILGLELLEYQKVLLREVEKGKKLYCIPNRHDDFTYTRTLAYVAKILLAGEKDNESDKN